MNAPCYCFRFKIRDMESNTVLFEIAKPPGQDPGTYRTKGGQTFLFAPKIQSKILGGAVDIVNGNIVNGNIVFILTSWWGHCKR